MKMKPLVAILSLLLLAPTGRAASNEYDLLRQISPARLLSLMANVPDAHGFVGANRQAGRWLGAGTQRGACRAVIAAVVVGDLAMADDAWRGVEVPFAHQAADGGFGSEKLPDDSNEKPPGEAINAVFFFLQELGRAIVVIRESPHEAHFHARIVALEPGMRRAMSYLSSRYDKIVANNLLAVNRIVIAAKAFGLCGLVLQDEPLVATSRKLVALALTRRDHEGVFIEKDGRDSSYNAVSILFGQVLALHVPIPEFEAALPAAVAWQLTCIRESGEVDVSGNTRTGVNKEKSAFGEPKKVNYGEVVQALTLYGLVHHDRAALAAADRVFAFAQSREGAKK